MSQMARAIRFLFATCLCVAIADCSPPPLHTDDRRIAITALKTYPALQANAMMWLVGVKGIGAANAIDCYRVVYPSSDENGKPIELSGLLALPHDAKPRGLVSFQHGTTSDRQAVPSNLSTDGLAAAIVFAGNGYAAIAPDYEGLGVSNRHHPYYVAADTARAVIDMLHAVRRISGVPASAPFLIGFSEGGYASLAAQRALEAKGEKVLATAAVAGAFNLRAIDLPWTLKGRSPQASIYLALWVRGYSMRYGQPLNTAFTQRYATLVPRFLDTRHSPDETIKALPRDPRALFTRATLNAIAGKGDHWLVRALADNEMGDWRAKAPIRLYYGSRDIDVPPVEAATTARQMSARGSDIRAVNAGAVGHNESILVAAPLIFDWLQSLSGEFRSGKRGT
jgi:dienelactone hydrolase